MKSRVFLLDDAGHTASVDYTRRQPVRRGWRRRDTQDTQEAMRHVRRAARRFATARHGYMFYTAVPLGTARLVRTARRDCYVVYY